MSKVPWLENQEFGCTPVWLPRGPARPRRSVSKPAGLPDGRHGRLMQRKENEGPGHLECGEHE